MNRRPDHLGKRKEFSEKTKRQIAERSGGVCEANRVPDFYGLPKACKNTAVDKDHIRPEGLGGPSTLENGADLCKPCHAIKSLLDTAMILNADKMGGRVGQQARRKRNGSKLQSANRWPKGRKIQSRRFS